jgi:hypothetical protein
MGWSVAAAQPDKSTAYVLGYTLSASLTDLLITLGLTLYVARSQRVRATFTQPYGMRYVSKPAIVPG